MTDAWAPHYATAAGLRHWPCEELVRFVGSHGARFGAILEVGCGNGANLWCLVEHATERVVGLDASAIALDLARTYMAERRVGEGSPLAYPGVKTWSMDVELFSGDCRAIPFAAASFDLVVDCMTSQHLPWREHAAAFAEYRRVLRPGGSLFLYHLDSHTHCESIARDQGNSYDATHLSLFPSVGLTCLPPASVLAQLVEVSGFGGVSRGRMIREYPGIGYRVASYSVIAAEAA